MTTESILQKPFAWIEIPAGKGKLPADQDGVSLDIPTETYWIAKFVITNAQFAKFVEAGGYTHKEWWSDEGWYYREAGWKFHDERMIQQEGEWIFIDRGWDASDTPWTQPRYWTKDGWNGKDQPVTGVSWFEIMAFCRWLSHVSGENITLPTIAQWQYAAQGTDGRTYPWGNEWNPDLCNNNIDGKGIGKPTPVTQYEGKGDSPFGVVEMTGNVRELGMVEGKNYAVICSGAWFDRSLKFYPLTYRQGIAEYNSDGGHGFRIARI